MILLHSRASGHGAGSASTGWGEKQQFALPLRLEIHPQQVSEARVGGKGVYGDHF